MRLVTELQVHETQLTEVSKPINIGLYSNSLHKTELVEKKLIQNLKI